MWSGWLDPGIGRPSGEEEVADYVLQVDLTTNNMVWLSSHDVTEFSEEFDLS